MKSHSWAVGVVHARVARHGAGSPDKAGATGPEGSIRTTAHLRRHFAGATRLGGMA